MKKIRIFLLLATVATMLLVGCRKDEEKVIKYFGATIESPESETKTYMVDEKWIVWDQGDEISVSSQVNGDSKNAKGTLTVYGTQQGTFQVPNLSPESWQFLALYPYRENNLIDVNGSTPSSSAVVLDFPGEQPYQNDFSFGHNSCPMVGFTDDVNIEFHSLCGIVRIELYSTVTPAIENGNNQVESITFTEVSSTPKQISGLFDVVTPLSHAPYLRGKGTDGADGNRNQITISVAETDDVKLGTGVNGFKSFYLTLPALNGNTSYRLQMTVTCKGGQFTKTMNVNTRRNAITKLPAINVSKWDPMTNTFGIVGNGTQLRPFQIYNVSDLKQVRDSFNIPYQDNPTNPSVYINGQKVSKDTYFQIMRSQITLVSGTKEWDEGIKGFKGHISYKGNYNNPAIINNSGHPLFESITQDGDVDGITLTGNMDPTQVYTAFLCGTNDGVINNCEVFSGAILSYTASDASDLDGIGVAGLCVTNNKSITNSKCAASLTARGHAIGGIALFNGSTGTIENCQMISSGSLQGADGACGGGICYKNEGTVKTSFSSFSMTSSTCNIGGIVYTNSGVVEGCYLTNAANITTSGSFGGVVNTNTSGGIVDYCRNLAVNMHAAGTTGGLVSTNSGGIIINSWVTTATTIDITSTTAFGGCLVGVMTSGWLLNSYSRAHYSNNTITTNINIGYAVGQMRGGNVDNCYCTNGTSTNTAPFYANYQNGYIGKSSGRTYAYDWDITEEYVVVEAIDASGVNGAADIISGLNTGAGNLNGGAASGWSHKCHTWTGNSTYPTLTNTDASSKKSQPRRFGRRR